MESRMDNHRCTLQFNIDFNDLLTVETPPSTDVQALLGLVDGLYPEEKFRSLIRRAVQAGFEQINFRVDVVGKVDMHSTVKELADHSPVSIKTLQAYDPFRVAVDEAHAQGAACYAWLTPFDDAGPVESTTDESHRYLCGKLQSRFSREHPEYQLLSRDGGDCMWGVYCFGHPEVQQYWRAHIEEVVSYGPDGVFMSDRTHSNINQQQQVYGFNSPVIDHYQQRYGHDPRDPETFDLARFSEILGEFYTDFLRMVSVIVRRNAARLAVKTSWQRHGHISPRLGSLDRSFFQWATWTDQHIIDELVIGGDLATGHDPEFVLPYYDVSAESVTPAWYRSQTSQRVALSRWLTLWWWGWQGKDEVTPQPNSMFTPAVVTKMLNACRQSGLDGLLMHEAVNIATHNQWDVYRRFVDENPS